jgi:hypothetical protein
MHLDLNPSKRITLRGFLKLADCAGLLMFLLTIFTSLFDIVDRLQLIGVLCRVVDQVSIKFHIQWRLNLVWHSYKGSKNIFNE